MRVDWSDSKELLRSDLFIACSSIFNRWIRIPGVNTTCRSAREQALYLGLPNQEYCQATETV
jgi:hypothetical protein